MTAIGVIHIQPESLRYFSDQEWEFIIAHECSHIFHSHLVDNLFWILLEGILAGPNGLEPFNGSSNLTREPFEVINESISRTIQLVIAALTIIPFALSALVIIWSVKVNNQSVEIEEKHWRRSMRLMFSGFLILIIAFILLVVASINSYLDIHIVLNTTST
jgi:uncharacterized membrane protein YjgN (DUF898 family)